jgi:hypothetical protein
MFVAEDIMRLEQTGQSLDLTALKERASKS